MEYMTPTNSGSPNTKYFIDCNMLKDYESVEVQKKLKGYDKSIYILKAFISHDSFQRYRNVVLKVGEHDKTIHKEHEFGQMLRDIPGFIKYICLIDCFDTFDKNKKKYLRRSPKRRKLKIHFSDSIFEYW